MPVTVYGLPHCSTCQKAVAYLEKRGVEVERFHDVKTEPLSEGQVRELAERVGGAGTLFSRRARKYRALGLHERVLSEEEMLRLMTEEYTFITRPVVVNGDRATAGFSMKRIDELVGG
ncbi:MAG TPA: ArsC/Spx/MgsR family protein [Longimicrobiaceae bacterium]|nr:ArsC/Spx/MgsR family protein [Longimicrobiaceae bacterium]